MVDTGRKFLNKRLLSKVEPYLDKKGYAGVVMLSQGDAAYILRLAFDGALPEGPEFNELADRTRRFIVKNFHSDKYDLAAPDSPESKKFVMMNDKMFNEGIECIREHASLICVDDCSQLTYNEIARTIRNAPIQANLTTSQIRDLAEAVFEHYQGEKKPLGESKAAKMFLPFDKEVEGSLHYDHTHHNFVGYFGNPPTYQILLYQDEVALVPPLSMDDFPSTDWVPVKVTKKRRASGGIHVRVEKADVSENFSGAFAEATSEYESVAEVGYADELGALTKSHAEIIASATEDGTISQKTVMSYTEGVSTVYFFADNDGIEALVLLTGDNLKAIKNFSGHKGYVTALLNYLVNIKGKQLMITPDEPLTPEGFRWVATLIKSPSGVKVTDLNDDPVGVDNLRIEWEKSKKARGTESGLTGIKISESSASWKKKLQENEHRLMPYRYFGIKEGKMTPSREKKREKIVLGMKKNKGDLKARYGDDWENVMYATATKRAVGESNGPISIDSALDKQVRAIANKHVHPNNVEMFVKHTVPALRRNPRPLWKYILQMMIGEFKKAPQLAENQIKDMVENCTRLLKETFDAEHGPAFNAITRRVSHQRLDLIRNYGIEAVMDAIREVSELYTDLEEIGSSDVSHMVNSVERRLTERSPIEETSDRPKMSGGERVAFQLGSLHGAKGTPRIDAHKAFGVFADSYSRGYDHGAESAAWHDDQAERPLHRR